MGAIANRAAAKMDTVVPVTQNNRVFITQFDPTSHKHRVYAFRPYKATNQSTVPKPYRPFQTSINSHSSFGAVNTNISALNTTFFLTSPSKSSLKPAAYSPPQFFGRPALSQQIHYKPSHPRKRLLFSGSLNQLRLRVGGPSGRRLQGAQSSGP